MTYRSRIEAQARLVAEAARDERLRAELRLLEHELPLARTDRWVEEREIEDMERALKWLRRTLKIPTPPEERRERARRRREKNRPPQPEPEPIIEEPANICWHWTKAVWGQRCRGNHVTDLAIMFGSCRANGADDWFWWATSLEEETPTERHGLEESAVRARVKAHEAVIDLAAGRLTVARQSDDQAAWALRRLSRDRPTERPKPRDLLSVLKQAMVDAHPDRPGGTSAAFIEARARYVQARRRLRA